MCLFFFRCLSKSQRRKQLLPRQSCRIDALAAGGRGMDTHVSLQSPNSATSFSCTGCLLSVISETQLLKGGTSPETLRKWQIRSIDWFLHSQNTTGAIIQMPNRDYPVENVSNKDLLCLTDIAVDLLAALKTTKEFYKTSVTCTKPQAASFSPSHPFSDWSSAQAVKSMDNERGGSLPRLRVLMLPIVLLIYSGPEQWSCTLLLDDLKCVQTVKMLGRVEEVSSGYIQSVKSGWTKQTLGIVQQVKTIGLYI